MTSSSTSKVQRMLWMQFIEDNDSEKNQKSDWRTSPTETSFRVSLLPEEKRKEVRISSH
jgi:hypothetical protein